MMLPADPTNIKDAAVELQTKLGPFLIALTAQQRKDRNKMENTPIPSARYLAGIGFGSDETCKW